MSCNQDLGGCEGVSHAQEKVFQQTEWPRLRPEGGSVPGLFLELLEGQWEWSVTGKGGSKAEEWRGSRGATVWAEVEGGQIKSSSRLFGFYSEKEMGATAGG